MAEVENGCCCCCVTILTAERQQRERERKHSLIDILRGDWQSCKVMIGWTYEWPELVERRINGKLEKWG